MIRLVFHASLEADEFLLLKHAFDMRHDHLKSDPETSCDSNLKSCQSSHFLDFSHLTRRSETDSVKAGMVFATVFLSVYKLTVI